MNDFTEKGFRLQPLFNNSLVKYRGNILFYKNWVEKGIESVKDIIHPNENRILSLQELQNNIGQNRANIIFQYNAIMNAIPRQWLQWIQAGLREEEIQQSDASILNRKLKEIRMHMQQKKEKVTPTASSFWVRKLGYITDRDAWSRAKQVTKETRLKVLHWKILHNIYPTNILLNKMNIEETNKCSYCNDIVDFIEHFFL